MPELVIIAMIGYLIAGTAFLFVWQLLFRRWRKFTWRSYRIALSVAVASAIGTAMILMLKFGYINSGSADQAFGAALVSFVAGGIVGLFALIVAWWLLGTRAPAASLTAAGAPDRQSPRNAYRRALLLLAVLPGVLLSLTLYGKLGELGHYVVFCMCVLGLAGLRESLFCSHRDSEHDKARTRRLLVVGLAGAGITLVILLWIFVVGGRYMHQSGRQPIWLIYLILAAIPIAVETRELRRLSRKPDSKFEPEGRAP
jgi:hypothetical protein